VLVVDDDESVRLAVMLMVDELGVGVDGVADGREAIEVLRLAPYALVFMDVKMPVCDGITATRAIRTTFPADRQPVIVGLTGWATEATRVVALAAGMDACVFKPVAVETVHAVLRPWLRP